MFELFVFNSEDVIPQPRVDRGPQERMAGEGEAPGALHRARVDLPGEAERHLEEERVGGTVVEPHELLERRQGPRAVMGGPRGVAGDEIGDVLR